MSSHNITLVTGLWEICRGDLTEGWSRSFSHYLEKFEKLLEVETNMIIFGDEELENFVKERRSDSNTQFVKRSVEWFKNNEYFDKIQKIRTNPSWYGLAGWLQDSTQAKLEMYNPLVMSKMFLLNDARILDKFNSEKIYWIDAGLANTVHMGYFTHDNVLEKIDKKLNKFSFVCFPYEADREVHGFDINAMNEYCGDKVDKVCRGGFFGGPKEIVGQMNTLYYDLLMGTLDRGLMGTEESLFTILLYLNPSLIDYVSIEGNGLLYKFFEDMKNDTAEIKSCTKYDENVNVGNGGVGLYVITFNSPKQFETLLTSMEHYDKDFLNQTKKYLLDNSTDLSTTPRYIELCNQYGFDHIKKDNLGIQRGRVFVAEHFEETDLSHYMFFEDDMFFYLGQDTTCKNGFIRKIPRLYTKVIDIIKKENLDFLKFNFTEFYGSHDKQWAWYNVPQDFRQQHWPFNSKLPQRGLDPNSPDLEFKHVKSHQGLPYGIGEVYLSNWPIVMSKTGNYKCYLETKFQNPFEQTIMSYCFQESIKGRITSGVLLATPTEHDRFEFYDASLRKEC